MITLMPRNVDEAKAWIKDFEDNYKGSIREVERQLGIARPTTRRRKNKAHEFLDQTPDTHIIKAKSVLVDAEGKTRLQWIKTDQKKEDLLSKLEKAVEVLAEDVPRQKPIKKPPKANDTLLACHILTDFHLGMLAEKEMGGGEWNLEIAEQVLIGWITEAIKDTKGCKTGVLCQLGDFLHFDSLLPVTPANKHVLDAACSADKMVKTAVRLLRMVINIMLEAYENVHVIMADANHDEYSSIWLRTLFEALYENEPRITIDQTVNTYYCYEWGETSLFFHHGHKRNMSNIDHVFAGTYREVYGRTKYSYGHIGHFHHNAKFKPTLMPVEIYPTLAAKDAYAVRGGYAGQRQAHTVVYSSKYGRIKEIVTTPEMMGIYD